MTDKLLFAGDTPVARTSAFKIGSPDFRTNARLLICGSRYFNDAARFDEIVDAWVKRHGRPAVIISGEAQGVDLLAKLYARRHNIEYEPHPAKWSLYGRAAGPRRNQSMVDRCTHLLALPFIKSVGTQDAIERADRAKRKGVPIHVTRIDIETE